MGYSAWIYDYSFPKPSTCGPYFPWTDLSNCRFGLHVLYDCFGRYRLSAAEIWQDRKYRDVWFGQDELWKPNIH